MSFVYSQAPKAQQAAPTDQAPEPAQPPSEPSAAPPVPASKKQKRAAQPAAAAAPQSEQANEGLHPSSAVRVTLNSRLLFSSAVHNVIDFARLSVSENELQAPRRQARRLEMERRPAGRWMRRRLLPAAAAKEGVGQAPSP